MSLVGGYSQPAYASADTVYTPYYQTRYESSANVPEQSYYPSAWSYNTSPNMSPASTDYSPPPGYVSSPNQLTVAQNGMIVQEETQLHQGVRVVKRRVTANRKERRRTLSINNAFAELRDCIPNVPADTKLSKIKTLRLATSYIAYLMDLLAQDDPGRAPEGGFKAELTKKLESREERRRKEIANLITGNGTEKKSKGRTGWPQHVWALELKHDP
ncbi:heart- and neural crest derivatives-expressed protein 2-like isoform X2 [Centruroides vittatus]|uniref:heart- and neural crest derivatives-expressed protein 2-like isoform X2 n=1 Tax=Centruroides vittatus TaxID=120091 RepID=UPI00350F2D7A